MSLMFSLGMILISLGMISMLGWAAKAGAKCILENTPPDQPRESPVLGESSPTNAEMSEKPSLPSSKPSAHLTRPVTDGDFNNHLKRMRDR